MKEEVTRINKLVAEGRLSPEDAADLIDAFYAAERSSQFSEKPSEPATEPRAEVPPPPPVDEAHPGRDPFRAFVESVEKMTKEGIDSVNWQEVAHQARENAKKGIEAIKAGLEDLHKGKINLSWIANQETREVTLPLVVGTDRVLRIDNPCGDVKIVGGFDVGSVTARARFKAATLDEAKAKALEYTLIVEESDHIVQLRQPDVSGLCVDLEVQMAGTGSVEVRSDSGDVEIMDTKGGARVNSRSGDVKLRGLVGPIEVSVESGNVSVEDAISSTISMDTKSGNVSAARVKGNLNARSASGNISVARAGARIVALETVSGRIAVDLDEPVVGSVSVRTVSGNSLVVIPEQSDCRVSLSTLRGSVSASIPLQDEARTDSRLTGRLGDGGGTLDVSAVTGEISLELKGVAVTEGAAV